MAGRRWLGFLLAAWLPRVAAGGDAVARPVPGCRQVALEGEVSRGQRFLAPLGEGLDLYLQPIASGWIVRVVPAGDAAIDPDYAEVATPPYRSVTPLSLSTDFSFRAQDAVGWNPRKFRFAADAEAYRRLVTLYRQLPRDGSPAAPGLQTRLAREVSAAIPAELQILDAALVPGSANQGRAAAAVSSRFAWTAHTLVSPAEKQGTALGLLLRMRFRLLADLPGGLRPAAEMHPAGACGLVL